MKYLYIIIIGFLVGCQSNPETSGMDKDSHKEVNNDQTPQINFLSIDELELKDLQELRLIRNEIFARHGYKFNSPDLQQYFSQKEWYQPINADVDSLITQKEKEYIVTINKIKNKLKNKILPDPLSLKIKLEEMNKTADESDKKFIKEVISTIDQFTGKVIDTTILTIGNIDDIGELDTIKSNVFVEDDTVFVSSSWDRDGNILWREKLKNPYLWINDSVEFDYEKRSLWITLTIALKYAIPELSPKENYSSIDKETAIKLGLWFFETKDIKMSESDYRNYFESFNGEVLEHGEPEIRNELLIWHEPTKNFTFYYKP